MSIFTSHEQSYSRSRPASTNISDITDRLLEKSTNAIKKIDENIDLTSSLRNSNSLITQIDTKIDGLTSNLQQYQYYLSQLNSLLIRSEFFEAQLNMLEAHNQLNSLRCSNGMPSLDDWRDKDLNWRTTEATLENLYLEYQYLTRQMEQLSDPSMIKTVLTKQRDTAPIFNEEVPRPAPTLQTRMSSMNLKPMRIVSKKKQRQRRNSLEISKKKQIAQAPVIHRPQQTFNQLPTPDTTFDNTFGETAELSSFQNDSLFSPVVLRGCSSRRNSHSTNRHTRSSSLPESIVSNMLETVKFSISDDSISEDVKKDRKFSLRHFISHETGLKTKGLIPEEDEEDIKDSEFLNSPVSINLENYLKSSVGKKNEEAVANQSVCFDEPVPEGEVVVFEHKLNRSNSCDSIFSTMKTEPYNPMNNKQQTMSWMKQFSKPQPSSVKESNVTTISVNNLSSSISSPSRKALSDLVSQNSSSIKPTPQKRFPFLFAAKKSSPLAATSTTTTAISKDEDQPASVPFVGSIPTPKRQLSVDDSSSYHSFESSYSNSQQHKQWSLLLNRFKPESFVPSKGLVTSEVGRPISKPHPMSIAPTTSNSSQNLAIPPTQDKIKGSFSTLTIGPNRSRIVQHGESSTLGQSLVLSSKISHAALKDALDSDFNFN